MAVAVLTPVIAHQGQLTWHVDPLVLVGLVGTAWLYHRGGRGAEPPWRARVFHAGLAAVAVALLTPLDGMAAELASAHMVQHVLLVLVAAPLLALAGPSHRLLRGLPRRLRRASGPVRRRLGLSPPTRRLRSAAAAIWLLHVVVLWGWHAAVLYDAALRSPVVHAVEHATFLATAVLFWVVVASVRDRRGIADGTAILLVFTMSLQSVFLSALLTFAPTPWYEGYATTTAAWGLDRLADQQLAGVIMWVPAGAVYLVAGLWLVTAWLRRLDAEPA